MTIIEKILSVPKSLYVSMRLCSVYEAWHLPVFVRYNTKIISLKGSVNFYGGGGGRLKIGFGSVGIFDKKYERTILQIDGIIVVKDCANIGHGSRICVGEKGRLTFGSNFVNTAKCTIVCCDHIAFGDDVLISWDTLVMDTDFHGVIDINNGTSKTHIRSINIGSSVWICNRAMILKGAEIADGCIIGAYALVVGRFTTPNTLLVGNPASEHRHGVTRDKSQD